MRAACLFLLLANASFVSAASITTSGSGTGFITFDANDVSISAEAFGSTGSASVLATGVTQGPVRMGVLEMFGMSGVTSGNAANSMALGSASCSGWGNGNACTLSAAYYEPFELGVAFTLGAGASFSPAYYGDTGLALSDFSFALFEGTVGPGGTTATLGAPVAVFDQSTLSQQISAAPEPASALLLATGLACVLAASAREASRRRYAAIVPASR